MEIVHSHKLTTIEEVKTFFFAGKATVTLRNSKSGNRFTFKISAPKRQDEKRPIFFVSLFTGKDNEVSRSYSFMGTVFGKSKYIHSRKSTIVDSSTPVLVVMHFIRFLERGILPTDVEVWHEGKCGRCGRKLTDPISILSGIGPECSKKKWKFAKKQLELTLEK